MRSHPIAPKTTSQEVTTEQVFLPPSLELLFTGDAVCCARARSGAAWPARHRGCRADVMVSTIKTPCPSHDINNPHAVKVVTDKNGRALYFFSFHHSL